MGLLLYRCAPELTTADIEREMDQSKAQGQKEGDAKDLGLGQLMTALLYSGRADKGTMCPVLINRLRSSDGKRVVDALRNLMVKWED
jgi:hypothetical protein